MAYCSKCGNEVAEGSSFCSNCKEEMGNIGNNLQNPSVSAKITDKDFRNRMVRGIKENIPGFALIDIDFPQFDDIPSLKLSNKKNANTSINRTARPAKT